MPQHKSAEKRMRQNERRKIRNKSLKTRLKTITKKVVTSPTKDEAKKHLNDAYKLYDKASSKNVVHKNTAARKKSKLAQIVQSKPAGKKKEGKKK